MGPRGGRGGKEAEVAEASRPPEPELERSGILREAHSSYASLIERIPPFGIEPLEGRLPAERNNYSSESLRLFNFAPTSSSDTLRARVEKIDTAFQSLRMEGSDATLEGGDSPKDAGPAGAPHRTRRRPDPLERVERLLTDSPPSPPGWDKPPSRAANRALTALVFNKEKMKKTREMIRNKMQAKEGQGSEEDRVGKGDGGGDEGVNMLGLDPLEAQRRAEMLQWAVARVDKRMELIHRQMGTNDPSGSPSGSLSPRPRKSLKTLGTPSPQRKKKKVTFGFTIQEEEGS